MALTRQTFRVRNELKRAMKAKPTKRRGDVVLEFDPGDEPLLAAAGRGSADFLFRLNKILVPIDFSECAKKALRYALPLASQHGAALTLLYVVPANYAVGEYGGIDYASLEAEMRASGERQLASLIVDEIGERVPADPLVQCGSPAAEIVAVARRMPADLIVISTHGHTGLKHALLGSSAEYVVRHAPCPVLVVREHEREFLVE